MLISLVLASTGSLVYKLKPSWTVTFIANNKISADMGASTIVHKTFIYVYKRRIGTCEAEHTFQLKVSVTEYFTRYPRIF